MRRIINHKISYENAIYDSLQAMPEESLEGMIICNSDMIRRLLECVPESHLEHFLTANPISPKNLKDKSISRWLEAYMLIINRRKNLSSIEAFAKEVSLTQSEVSNLLNQKAIGFSETRRDSLVSKIREKIKTIIEAA